MSKKAETAVELFKRKAEPVSIRVTEVKDLKEAMAYALDICEKKDACQLLLTGCEQNLSDSGQAHCERPQAKVVAAPALGKKDYAALAKLGEEKGFTVIREGMRNHLAGIDVGFSTADMAIAETATCVLECQGEDARLAGMVCEIHVIALPKSRIVNTSYEAEEYLHKLMSDGPMYTAFISGPSRTADIERVLTIGVHGPLELHVALMEG
jgi:L-lactate dehydrogenase complex protein LldG